MEKIQTLRNLAKGQQVVVKPVVNLRQVWFCDVFMMHFHVSEIDHRDPVAHMWANISKCSWYGPQSDWMTNDVWSLVISILNLLTNPVWILGIRPKNSLLLAECCQHTNVGFTLTVSIWFFLCSVTSRLNWFTNPVWSMGIIPINCLLLAD